MKLAIISTRSIMGIHAQCVSVEIHLSNGLPSFTIVGLPATAVKESKDRVRSAILTSQFEFPCCKITVNLAPADLPKIGSGFDLPIAIGILAASGQIPLTRLDSHEFIGELALNGNLRAVAGVIPAALATHKDQHSLVIASANANEASLVDKGHIYTAENLREVCSYICENTSLLSPPSPPPCSYKESRIDWTDVKGQQYAKYAMEVAACGGHSLLLNGPPGSGKTMLATRFHTLLPELPEAKALECAAIRSIRERIPDFVNWRQPPFRSPHHTTSAVALIGGGSPPKPGEISLAHNGILFLDELPEFHRNVLETLRQPLESGTVFISRAAAQSEFPARFQLIAAMNPCPCGHWGNPKGDCGCTPERINRYLGKLSAPLLDRIDIHITVQALPEDELIKINTKPSRTSQDIRELVIDTQQLQLRRQGCLNAQLNEKECELFCNLDLQEQHYLSLAIKKLKLSARGFYRVLKIARTITDMRKVEKISKEALQQALSFRETIRETRI